jgi:hypothetical protein
MLKAVYSHQRNVGKYIYRSDRADRTHAGRLRGHRRDAPGEAQTERCSCLGRTWARNGEAECLWSWCQLQTG